MSRYGGNLLDGLDSYEDNRYAFWLDLEREALHRQWRGLIFERASQLSRDKQFERSAELLQRLLRQDELDEEALAAYMTALAREGQGRRALGSYNQFVKTLKREMGLTPTSATEQLAEDLRRAPQNFLEPPSALETKTVSSLPMPATSFVGRDVELSAITHALTGEGCRLLTLLGSGVSEKRASPSTPPRN